MHSLPSCQRTTRAETCKDPHTADDEEGKPTKKPHMDDEEDSPEAHAKTHTRLMMRKESQQKTTHG